jgi:hypothetical protein
MELTQFNYFVEHGVLTFEDGRGQSPPLHQSPNADGRGQAPTEGSKGEGRLVLHPERYEATVTELLREVLAIQAAGDPKRAEAFFSRWTSWTDELHAPLAKRLRDAEGPRYRLMRYAALGE